MNQQFIPLDLVLEAARILHADCQISFRRKLYKLIEDEKPEQPTAREIEKLTPKLPRPPVDTRPLLNLLSEVGHRHKVSARSIVEEGNQQLYVRARREFCRLARIRGYSLTVIGGVIKRHHATVLYLSVTNDRKLVRLKK